MTNTNYAVDISLYNKGRTMKATANLQIENERVIVKEWIFAPGEETEHHVHPHDYVTVPLISGVMRIEGATGTKENQLVTGVSYTGVKGTAHNVINIENYELRFIEIELK